MKPYISKSHILQLKHDILWTGNVCIKWGKNQGIREIPRKFLTEFYVHVAGDYMKFLNFRDYVKSLVTHIPGNIYNEHQ